MQEIKAFIRPNMLNAVLQALHEHPDFPGVTVSEVRGFGKVAGRDPSQPSGYGTVSMVKLECIVEAGHAAEVVQTIQEHAATGRPGDGKIAIQDVSSVTRIRTGETGRDAMI
ncbi:MAG: GlnB [Phycisphaerae bacterium]|nr:GlnB [Phycisphaerae bacterium]MBM92966.1 GlnB [Phycisphaerae bacterium]|tara:strand:+ start:1667 stop:2002 length:336 start_codon:yes stop_codon:yes gene_type:complete